MCVGQGQYKVYALSVRKDARACLGYRAQMQGRKGSQPPRANLNRLWICWSHRSLYFQWCTVPSSLFFVGAMARHAAALPAGVVLAVALLILHLSSAHGVAGSAAAQSPWTPVAYPNPYIDVAACGRGFQSSICEWRSPSDAFLTTCCLLRALDSATTPIPFPRRPTPASRYFAMQAIQMAS
jgi:hypothetical protein